MERKVAIVTGATSGIGKEFAFKLAEKGYDLIVVGRREELLNDVADKLRKSYGITVDVNILDLSDTNQLDIFYDKVKEIENVEFLVNNAGLGIEGIFSNDEYKNQEKLLKVHVDASTKITHGVISNMKKNKSGYIVNVASLAGFNAFPDSLMYCSTKSYLITMSQCLAMELIAYNIKVQALCPGFTITDFHKKLDMDVNEIKKKGIMKWGTTKDVVDYSLKLLEKKMKVIAIPGLLNRILYWIVKIVPKIIYYKIAAKGWDLLE